ncbi:hypothetical protein PV325_011667 [Microctonus aethiopoides]|nr:hypothetical protein PV325_011667 [Microctonus aethiopoides]
MHETHSFRLNEQYHTDLDTNTTTSRPIQLAGKVDNSGSCKGGSYADHYGCWDDVVDNVANTNQESAWIQITDIHTGIWRNFQNVT